jgi:hypothetical protein
MSQSLASNGRKPANSISIASIVLAIEDQTLYLPELQGHFRNQNKYD